MSEKVKVFKVTLCVVDHDGIGEDELTVGPDVRAGVVVDSAVERRDRLLLV